MSRSVTVTSDPRPVPASRERRCMEIRMLFEKGNPNIVVEGFMERWYLDSNGNTLGSPDRDNQPIVRRVFTPAMIAGDATAANFFATAIGAFDSWDVEDGNAV